MILKKKKGINLLELTPERNMSFEEKDNLINILIPKFKNNFFQSLIPKNKSKEIKINLDELGSAVWMKIDGKKKVSDLIDELSEQFGEKIQPAEERITKFITQLHQHKFIKFKELS